MEIVALEMSFMIQYGRTDHEFPYGHYMYV